MTIQDVTPWLESAQYVAVIAGTVFAIFQYSEAKKARRQEKAAVIMRSYSDTVLKIGGIEALLNLDENIIRIINKIDAKSPLSFALYERKEYGLTERETNEYMKYITDTDVSTPVNKDKVTSYRELIPLRTRDSLPESCSIGQLAMLTLNEVEHLSMEIESAAVDDEYIYGSLHQTLTPFIHKLAIMIQSLNKSSLAEENYYPYTKKLYNRWVTKESDNFKKMKKQLRGVSRKKSGLQK